MKTPKAKKGECVGSNSEFGLGLQLHSFFLCSLIQSHLLKARVSNRVTPVNKAGSRCQDNFRSPKNWDSTNNFVRNQRHGRFLRTASILKAGTASCLMQLLPSTLPLTRLNQGRLRSLSQCSGGRREEWRGPDPDTDPSTFLLIGWWGHVTPLKHFPDWLFCFFWG